MERPGLVGFGPSETMKATLSLFLGHEVENSVNLTRPGIYVIGRHPEVALRVYDIRASKRHCMLLVTPKQVRLRDFGSLNGTEVDGDVISFKADRQEDTQSAEETMMGPPSDRSLPARPEAVIRDGSVIRLGTSEIKVSVDPAAIDRGTNSGKEEPLNQELGPEAMRVVGVEGKVTFMRPDDTDAGGDVDTAFGKVFTCDITGISPTGIQVGVSGLTRRDYFKLVMRSSVLRGIISAPLLGTPELLRLPGAVKWSDFHPTKADHCTIGFQFEKVPPLTRGALMDLFA